MITQTMLDFSNVALSRRRKPYFIQRLQCWYFKDASGLPHRLHPNEQRAHELWRQIMGAKVVPGVLPPTPKKPMKPYRGFPGYAHPNGQWAKKLRGRTLYFGPWSNWKRALEVYESLKPRPAATAATAAATPSGTTKPLPKRYKFDRNAPRARVQLLRVLKLLDALAAFRLPKSLDDIHYLMIEATGQKWSQRTVERDLRLLDEMGLVDVSSQGFKLNLARSERLQMVAVAMFE